MIIVVTFRIPNAALAGVFSILLARENFAATWRGGQLIVLGFVLASLYTLLGIMLFRGFPSTHFFWVIGSLYLVFFVMRTTTNYAAALAFAIPIGVALPVWDSHLPSELQVEGTLWLIVVIAVGTGATVLTEALYRIFDRSDPLITFGDDLLLAVQQVTESLASLHTPPQAVLDRVRQYQMIGTGRLRMTLQRQGGNPARRAQRSALISLASRLTGLAADLGRTPPQPGYADFLKGSQHSERSFASPGLFPHLLPGSRGSRPPASPCFKRWNEPSHSSPKSFPAMSSSMVPRTREGRLGGALYWCLMHSRIRNIHASPLPDA
jgi:multidrug resistance protein MdtO